MANISKPTVTIDRDQFDRLIKRASVILDPQQTTEIDSLVCITTTEHEALQFTYRQYENLINNLVGAGVTVDQIAILSSDENAGLPVKEAKSTLLSSELKAKASGLVKAPISKQKTMVLPTPSVHPARSNLPWRSNQQPQIGSTPVLKPKHMAEELDIKPRLDPTNGSASGVNDIKSNSLQLPEMVKSVCRRSMILVGLPPDVTYRDVLNVVRGGPLVEVFILEAKHSASVSFIYDGDALQFFEHVRNHGAYIKGRKISIGWEEYQQRLTTSSASSLRRGARRNMIIRNCPTASTGEVIRAELEHIDDLVVIDIDFMGRDCFVKTNSARKAIYARTCLESRNKYRMSLIDWDKDECEKPIEIPSKAEAKPPAPPASPKVSSSKVPEVPGVPSFKDWVANKKNPFSLLRIDDDDGHIK